MRKELFFKDERLPFAEARYSQSSQAEFKPHIHRSFSIGAIDQGTVRYSVDEVEEILKPGMLAIINPENLHSCNTVNNCQRSFFKHSPYIEKFTEIMLTILGIALLFF